MSSAFDLTGVSVNVHISVFVCLRMWNGSVELNGSHRDKLKREFWELLKEANWVSVHTVELLLWSVGCGCWKQYIRVNDWWRWLLLLIGLKMGVGTKGTKGVRRKYDYTLGPLALRPYLSFSWKKRVLIIITHDSRKKYPAEANGLPTRGSRCQNQRLYHGVFQAWISQKQLRISVW